MTGIEESYGRAVGSSHLECTDELGDVHLLIAAGKVPDSLGTRLLRLRGERDSISGLPGARLIQLKSWERALADWNRLAFAEADKVRLHASMTEIEGIVRHVLDLYLNPNCPHCNGVGTQGGYGAPQVVCPACGGSKKRKLFWGERLDFEDFSRHLAEIMNDRTRHALRRISVARREIAEALQSAI